MTGLSTFSRQQRQALPVLVPEAHALGMIAVIRSLGRAGYPVHACDSRANALGLKSRFAHRATVCPRYDDAAFLPWLEDYTNEHAIRTIVPSEAFLVAIRPVFDRYSALLPISRDPELVYLSLSKAAVFGQLSLQSQTAQHMPPTIVLDEGAPLPDLRALEALGLPLFVKADAVDAASSDHGKVIRCETSRGARESIAQLRRQRYRRVLVQGFVPGQGTGAYFLVRNGRIEQEFMNRCLHEVPHTGGFCSLRDSWWHEPMMNDARAKVQGLQWQGVVMVEYRWDPDTDRFWFIEINARFWAALHLALYAGVDFPRKLVDGHHGAAAESADDFRVGVQCRYTVPAEIGYVRSRLADPALPLHSRVRSVVGWVARFFNPFMYADLDFPADRRLYWIQWCDFVGQTWRGLVDRARRRGVRHP